MKPGSPTLSIFEKRDGEFSNEKGAAFATPFRV